MRCEDPKDEGNGGVWKAEGQVSGWKEAEGSSDELLGLPWVLKAVVTERGQL